MSRGKKILELVKLSECTVIADLSLPVITMDNVMDEQNVSIPNVEDLENILFDINEDNLFGLENGKIGHK